MKKKNLLLFIGIVIAMIGFLPAYTALINPLRLPYEKPNPAQSDDSKYQRGHNVPGKLYWAGSAQDKQAALTFDDGPDATWTPQILEILREKHVKATFFVIGSQAQKYPEMLRQLYSDGHTIGNHTQNHLNLVKLDPPKIDEEIEQSSFIIREIIGKTPRLIRPPYGFHNTAVDNAVYGKGGIIVLWSLDTKDWMGPDAKTIKASILPKMQNGYIILQHDGENPKLTGSVQVLPDIIDDLKAKGYSFVTIDKLLNVEAYQ